MTSFCPVVEGASVRLVPDVEYLRVMQTLAASARELLWCSVFLIELTPMVDPDLLVPGVLRALASARWRGVDVRLLIGGSRTNLEIAEDAATALKVARRLGLPARWIQSSPVRGSHIKLVIADDYVLTGSHNWSPGAFGSETQDSVLAHSPDLAAYLGELFVKQWQRAGNKKGAAA
jgi:phosphatidylserine/phosphatidylglycerophosphate/cardiolipin synthase-like enzyme